VLGTRGHPPNTKGPADTEGSFPQKQNISPSKSAEQQPSLSLARFLHSAAPCRHPAPSSLPWKKNQARDWFHSHHVCVSGVLQASGAGVLALQLPAAPARRRGWGRRRGGRSGGRVPVPDADERGEPGEAARHVPAGAEEAEGARRVGAVPEAAVRGGGVQPAAGGAGAALLAPAPRAARREEAPAAGGLPGADDDEEEQAVAASASDATY
jgi:hypothetical protein